MKKLNLWMCLAALAGALAGALAAAPVRAEFEPEPVGVIESLDSYPPHWIMVRDFSFFHMLEGKVQVVDPLGETLGEQFKGMITASFIAAYERSATRNELYVIEDFFSRGGRGGERTGVVAIYDPATLAVIREVVIPPKRITGMPKLTATNFIGGERFLGVYNFTPAQSVSIVDLESREFVAEVSTPGCGFVIPNGKRSFTSICSNGAFLTSHLNADGTLKDTAKTDVLFDPQNDPIFETPAMLDGVAYFPTFSGQIMPLDVSGETVAAGDPWPLATNDEEATWRPGGMNLIMVDSAGLGYVLMHPEGGEGTHKNGGSEVWVYDFAAGERKGRIELKNWGLSLGNSGRDEQRFMFVTNTEMAIDMYSLPDGEYLKTLNTGAATPFIVEGAQ